jgi:hypothetical protein
MPPPAEAGVVSLVDRLQAVIKDVPAEYLDDVEQATRDLFQIRRDEANASASL